MGLRKVHIKNVYEDYGSYKLLLEAQWCMKFRIFCNTDNNLTLFPYMINNARRLNNY